MIIFRYISREIFYVTIAITAIVVFIFLTNQFARYLDYVATGKYAAGLLVHIVLLQLPVLFGLLLPLGLFLAVLLTYGKLYANSELIVLMSCGVSRKQLVIIALRISVIVIIMVSILVNWVGPIVAKKRDQMMDLASSAALFQTITPGRFTATQHGKRVFYVGKMSRDREKMRNIFVSQQLSSNPNEMTQNIPRWAIISARSAYPMVDAKTGDRFMVAEEGYRYQGVAGQKNFDIVKYDTYGVRVDAPKIIKKHEGSETVPTITLLKNAWKNKAYMAELQWRLSVPLSAVILVLLAVPLSQVKPRQGRFAQLIPGVLIYICYANLMILGKSWIEDGIISWWLGLWWIHLGLLLITIWFYFKLWGLGFRKRNS